MEILTLVLTAKSIRSPLSCIHPNTSCPHLWVSLNKKGTKKQIKVMREEICKSFEWKRNSSVTSLLFSILFLKKAGSDCLGLVLDLKKRGDPYFCGPNPSDQSKVDRQEGRREAYAEMCI